MGAGCNKKHYKIRATLMDATGYRSVVAAGLAAKAGIPGDQTPGYARTFLGKRFSARQFEIERLGSLPRIE
jgi:hypothetical protein